ncbi:MAG: SBBP repeat-containing protein [candidate division WOR-3 bacterium]
MTIKYDSSGNEQWVARYNGTGDSIDYAYELAIDDSGNVYVTGASRTQLMITIF